MNNEKHAEKDGAKDGGAGAGETLLIAPGDYQVC